MKYTLQILLQLLLFGLFSCANPNITAQLNLADSLFATAPDSAYTVINAIDPEDLRGDKQHAQYALLFTQAQYKNYEPIPDDSLIDIAVDYYQRQNDSKKLTEAYMYKGAALTDMDLSREAMEWYKKAELTADSTDYLTLGLINTRMGELYQNMYINNDEHIDKYKRHSSFSTKREIPGISSRCQIYLENYTS